MSNYRRCYVPGGSYFFTVVTERRAKILVTILPEIYYALLFRTVFNADRRFAWMRWVMLHDYMHAIWMLPPDDRPIQNAGARLKNISLNPGLRWAERNNPARHPALLIAGEVYGNVTTQNILYAMKQITDGILITFITIR